MNMVFLWENIVKNFSIEGFYSRNFKRFYCRNVLKIVLQWENIKKDFTIEKHGQQTNNIILLINNKV